MVMPTVKLIKENDDGSASMTIEFESITQDEMQVIIEAGIIAILQQAIDKDNTEVTVGTSTTD